RRIPPRILELRLSRQAQRRRSLPGRAQDQVPGPAAQADDVARDRQDGADDAHPMIEHFKFVAAHANATPRMTIPSPSSLHFRYGRDAVPAGIYPGVDDFYRGLGESYRAIVRALADPGCRYFQLAGVNLAYLCDPKLRAFVADRGDDPQTLPLIYAGMINAAISDAPANMTKAMHLCRGNFQSTFVASGGYEPVAEILFNAIDIDAYFMEYDSNRAGGFEPLRFVPKGQMVGPW